jgi:hypothetical protein
VAVDEGGRELGAGTVRVVWWVAAAVAVVFVLASIVITNDDGSSATRTTTSTTRPAPRRLDPTALDGAGTPLVDGFRAPVNTRVIGIDSSGLSSSRSALLLIERGPSGVARDVVAQAIRLGARWSGRVYQFCAWGPAPGSTTTTHQSPPTPGPLQPGPGLRCDLGFSVRAGSRYRTVEVSVQWGKAYDQGAAHLYIETTERNPQGEGEASPDLSGAPEDPAPMVPSGLDADLPQTGEKFGRSNDCFTHGYSTFRVPPGTTLVAPPSDLVGFWDFEAYLRTDDPKKAIENLQAQIVGGRQSPSERVYAHRVAGVTIWEAPGGDQAGGGGCWVHSTPDGQVVVAAHSD